MSDKTPVMTVKMLHRAVWEALSHTPDQRPGEGLDALRLELERLRDETPATPEPKFQKDDWVVMPTCHAQPWLVTHVRPTASIAPRYVLQRADLLLMDAAEQGLLPIPPKPEKVTDGYELAGEARPPKQDEYYVSVNGKDVERASWDWEDWGYESYFGGRRWIVRETNKCAECGREMPK